MRRKKIDRTSEETINNFGSKMVIKEYRSTRNVDVYFPKYNWVAKNTRYDNFKNGTIKCPYEPRYFGVGYLGEGKYTVSENGKLKKEFKIWYDMIKRCYDPKYQEEHSTYKGCKVEDYLLNFQYMAEWINENYYEVSGEKMCLDKDILYKGNKVYSRETCIFVPERINLLFVKSNKSRGDNPIGTYPLPSGNYRAMCSNGYGKNIPLGVYSTPEEAFKRYKQCKENYIKQVANEYKGRIPDKLYNALYNYEVEIDD